MKHIQPKTLQVIVAILTTRRFSQRELWRRCNRNNEISIGLVNKVVNGLLRNGFVERLPKSRIHEILEEEGLIGDDTLESNIGRTNYALADPLGLLRFISLLRSMDDLRLFTLFVDASETELKRELSKKDAILCLGTAQQHYTPYYRPDEVSFYSRHPKRLYNFLKTAKAGNIKISCYRIDYVRTSKRKKSVLDSLFAFELEDIRLTTKVQTVIDMFCDEKGVYTKPLLRELWGVEI